jgi:hypothetical protein
MWGATYDEDDGWRFDRRWPGLARRWLEAYTATDQGNPEQWVGRTWGDYDGTQVDLEAWPTPSDVGLGINVDWEGPWPGHSETRQRITAGLHLGLVTITLTWWRPPRRR